MVYADDTPKDYSPHFFSEDGTFEDCHFTERNSLEKQHPINVNLGSIKVSVSCYGGCRDGVHSLPDPKPLKNSPALNRSLANAQSMSTTPANVCEIRNGSDFKETEFDIKVKSEEEERIGNMISARNKITKASLKTRGGKVYTN